MKGSWKKALMGGLWLGLCLPFLAACSHDDEGPGAVPAREQDCEVTMSVRIEASSLRGMGDPGSDAAEGAGWTKIDVFLVYNWGQVLQYTINGPSTKEKFMAYAGQLKGVYAVAYQEVAGHVVAASDEQAILDLQTASLNDMNDNNVKREYLLSLFSGKSMGAVEIVKGGTNEIKVTLHRAIAKVDVQWDVQDAYDPEGGNYVEAKMGSITLSGMDKGYFFSESHTSDGPFEFESTYTANAPVSERNGRTYFYTFAGAKNSFAFKIKHRKGSGSDMTTSYTATFGNALPASSWHKVNLTVSGKTFKTEATGENVDLTLTTPTTQNN